PLQCRIALEIAGTCKILIEEREFSNVIFCGMGGSAIGGDLLRTLLYFETNLPILVFRDYSLASFINERSLVFLSSYSGDTEETLSCYEEVKRKTKNIIGISSGGKLKQLCQDNKFTFIQIPPGLPPRSALGYLSLIPLEVLGRLGLISKYTDTIIQTISYLENLRDKKLSPKVSLGDNPAKLIAKKLFNKFVIIYTSSIHFDVCALRLKAQINENAKAPAWTGFFPEMNHNEIVGWQNLKRFFKNFIILNLKDQNMHPRILKRMWITKEILEEEGLEIIELNAEGNNLLSKIFSLIYIGDFISFYLAMLYGVDPTPVERISFLKRKLAEDK
ncbi:MAG: bifunctional phosphoglucose/phosphomannose isomerase, partial [Candidatus Omnitrophica bacterium]|nr:bifunctional phosphoglucose/phosphomannose isomerase [Candidatus Omnitrophota bacterium]